MSDRAAIGDSVLSWSAAFVIAGFIALALDCDGLAVVLFAIAGGLLVTSLFILVLTLWVAVGKGRSPRRNPSSTAGGGSGSSMSASLRSSTDSNSSTP